MKIAFIIQDLFGQGAQYSTAAMARELVREGHQVDLLLSQVHADKVREGRQMSFALDRRIRQIYLPYRKARQNVFAIRRYLKTSDADAVISTSGPTHKAHCLASLGVRTKSLNVCMNHGNAGWDEAKACPIPQPRILSKAWIVFHWVYARFDRIFFVDSRARELFLGLCPEFDARHAHVVYNPCIDETFRAKSRLMPQHPWLVEKICPTFISAGVCDIYKGHWTMLKAFAQLKGRVNVRLVHFGVGHLKAEYEKFVQDNGLGDMVSIAGYTNQLPAEMKAADGFILSSVTESFGIVLVEALASKLPIISTDAPLGPREVLDDGKYGRIVPVGDVEAMAQAIAEEVAHPSPKPPSESWQRFTADRIAKLFLKGLSA